MGKDIRIAVRVTAMKKEKIQAKARKCGLSVTEYVKQRALGYEPRAVQPVPLHIRNAPTKLMKDLGYHDGYKIGRAHV